MEQLTYYLSGEFEPDFDATSERLIFVSDTQLFLSVFMLELKTGDLRSPINVQGDATHPRFNYNNRKIFFSSRSRDAEGDIFAYSLSTRRMHPIIAGPSGESRAEPSPDNNWLVYSKNEGNTESLWLQPLFGKGTAHNLIEGGGTEASWSSDSRKIVFSRRTKEGRNLFLYSFSDRSIEQITFGESIDLSPSFSPDSGMVVFSRILYDTDGDTMLTKRDKSALFIVDVNTLHLRQLTEGRYHDFSPRWRDSWIYFSSDRSGNFDIWRISEEGQIPDAPDEKSQWDEVLKQSDRLAQALALKKFLGFYRDSPLRSKALLKLAGIYHSPGFYNEALSIYRKLSQEEVPEQILAIVFYNLVLCDSGFPFQEIISVLEDFSKGERDYCSFIYYQISLLLEKRGRLSQALQYIQRALHSPPYLHTDKSTLEFHHATLKLRIEGINAANYQIFANIWNDESLPASLRLRAAEYFIDHFWDPSNNTSAQHEPGETPQSILNFIRSHESDNPAGYVARRKLVQFYHSRDNFPDALQYIELCKNSRFFSDDDAAIVLYLTLLVRVDRIFEVQGFLNQVSDGQGLTHETKREITAFLLTESRSKKLGHHVADALELVKIIRSIAPNDAEALKLQIAIAAESNEFSELEQELTENLAHRQYLTLSKFGLELIKTYTEFNPSHVRKSLLPIAQRLERLSESDAYFPWSYQTIAWIYEQIGRETQKQNKDSDYWYEQALKHYQKALMLLSSESTAKSWADLHLNLGNIYYWLKKYNRAVEHYEAWRSFSSSEIDDTIHTITTFRLGRSLFFIGESSKATSFLESAIEGFREYGRKDWLYTALMEAGLVYYDLNEYQKANDSFLDAIKTAETGKLDINNLVILRNVAINHYYLGNLDESLRSFYTLITELKSKKSHHRKRIETYEGFDFTEELRLAYTFIAEIFRQKGMFRTAISNQYDKLALYADTGEEDWKARILNSIGELFFLNGQIRESMSVFNDSSVICKSLEQSVGYRKNLINLHLLSAILTIYSPEEAVRGKTLAEDLEVLENEIKLMESAEEQLPYLLLLVKLKHLSLVFSPAESTKTADTNQTDDRDLESKKFSKRSRHLSIQELFSQLRYIVSTGMKMSEWDIVVEANLVRASLSFSLGDFELAAMYLDRSEDISRLHYLHYHHLLTTMEKAALQMSLGATDDGLVLLRQAIRDYEKLIEGKNPGEIPLRIMPNLLALYDDIIALLLDKKEYEKAFFYSERKRCAREILFMKTINGGAGSNPRTKLIAEYKKLQESLEKSWNVARKDERWDYYIAERTKINELMAKHIRRIEKDNPALPTYLEIRAWGVQEVRSILEPGEGIAVYHLEGKTPGFWFISNDFFAYYSISVSRETLLQKIQMFMDSIKQNNIPLIEQLSTEIRRCLFGPMSKEIASLNLLSIIPDRELELLPLGLLGIESISDSGDELFFHFMPSIAEMIRCYERDSFERRKILTYDFYKEIKKSQFKTSSIEDFFPVFTNRADDQSTISNFIQEESMDDFDVIHLNVPFYLNNINPAFSYFQFQEKEFLLLEQLQNVPLNANLFCLDLSDSDYLKKNNRVLSPQITSVLEGIFFAGVSTILVELWPHDSDEARTLFYRSFYQAYEEKRSKVECLRIAQKAVQKSFPQPQYWAGYLLYGHKGFSFSDKKEYLLRKKKYVTSQLLQANTAGDKNLKVKYFDELVDIYKEFSGTEKQVFSLFNNLISLCYELQLYDSALNYITKMFKLLEDWRPENFRKQQATLHQKRGAILFQKGDVTGAIKDQQLYLESLDDKEEYVLAVSQLCSYFMDNRDYQRGISRIEETLSTQLNKSVSSYSLALLLYQKGAFQNKLHMSEEAEETLNGSLSYLEAHEETKSDTLRINVLHELSLLNQKKAEYTRALEFCERALTLAQSLHDKKRIFTSFIIAANTYWFMNMGSEAYVSLREAEKLNPSTLFSENELFDYYNIHGLLHLRFGDFEKAEKSFIKIQEISQNNKNKTQEAIALNQMGLLATHRKRFTDAEDFFKKALFLNEELRDFEGKAYALKNLGIVKLENAEYETAKHYFDETASIAGDINNKRLEVDAMTQLGLVYLKLSELELASKTFQRARNIAEKLQMSALLWKIYWKIGTIHRLNNEIDMAEALFQQAERIVEGFISNREWQDPETQADFSPLTFYHELIQFETNSGKLDKAFITIEHYRSFKLARFLEYRSQTPSASISHLIDTESPQNAEKGPQDAKVKAIHDFQVTTLRNTQESLRNREAVLSFCVTESRIFSWFISSQDLHVAIHEMERNQLEQTVKIWLQYIEKGLDEEDYALSLYDILVRPHQAYLHDITSLIIVADDVLSQIPFAALKPAKNACIIDFFDVSYQLSCSTMKHGQDGNYLAATDKILAIGLPILENQTFLPYSKSEILTIAALYKNTYTLLGIRASKETFTEIADSYPYVHLATHTDLNEEAPLLSSLLFVDDKMKPEKLTVLEILQMSLNINCICLNGCSTMKAPPLRIRESFGIGDAFLLAGADRVIGTICSVDDLDAARFMRLFYSQCKKKSLVRAINDTQRHIKNLNRAPKSWAPYQFYGDLD